MSKPRRSRAGLRDAAGVVAISWLMQSFVPRLLETAALTTFARSDTQTRRDQDCGGRIEYKMNYAFASSIIFNAMTAFSRTAVDSLS